jgi:hypothetical protein
LPQTQNAQRRGVFVMEIKFVYENETWIEENFEGQKHELTAPKGEGHIFAVELVKGKKEASCYSLCKKSRVEIGKKTIIRQNRVAGLPVCAECSELWKKHPESQWSKFVQAGAK